MATTPDVWIEWIHTLCIRAGLSAPDAEECVCEILQRYCRRRGAYPWNELAPDERLLRLVAHNVACEYQRTSAHRQRPERDYCAQQQALARAAETPEHQAISNVDAERFRAKLPRYLRETLTLLEAGYTPAEIARTLGVCESTVRTYRRELKAKFVKYFGYDPTNRGSCVVL